MMNDTCPVLSLDPYSEVFLRNPYPYYELLREAGPIARLSKYGVWAAARYSQVHAILNDCNSYCSGFGVGLSNFSRETPWRVPSLLLEADPPAHTQNRAVVAKVLSRRVLQALRATFEEVADRLLNELVARRCFDAITDLAQAFPLSVFPDAVGIGPHDRSNLLHYGDMVFNAFGPRNARLAESMTRAETVTPWITVHCRRDALGANGFGAAILVEAQAQGLAEGHAELLVRSLLTAGVDTTVSALSGALVSLAHHPDQWKLLHENPALAREAFEESVRFESPVQSFCRTTSRAVEIADVQIPAGEKVIMFLGAANRDPRRWPSPNNFDICRKPANHVAFGAGIHACVGQMIARLEGEVVLAALARRARTLQPMRAPEPHLNNTLRAWRSFPVEITPA